MKEKFHTTLVTNKRAIKEGKSVHTCNKPNKICVGTQCNADTLKKMFIF
jgi:hypothetical protein